MVRRVLVTGGTGTIGQALVRRFARDRPVIFQYRQNSRVADQLERETGAQGWQADLREENIEVPEEITILINNAGINEGDERTSDVSESAWREAIEINLTATWRVTRQVPAGDGCGRLGADHHHLINIRIPCRCRELAVHREQTRSTRTDSNLGTRVRRKGNHSK